MKRIKIYVALATICAVSLAGCRPEGEDILSYGYNDAQAFAPAGESYAAQFELLWTAMNCNYGIWDYEEELGVDWDQVHKEGRHHPPNESGRQGVGLALQRSAEPSA